MIIAGIDISLTSPGVVKAVLNENLDVVNYSWLAFTTVKKMKSSTGNLYYYKKFPCYMDRSIFMKEKIMNFLYIDPNNPPDYVAIEDYAFLANGLVFHIGGFTEILKLDIYQRMSSIRLYDITLIKKFAASKGNADKIRIYDEFMKLPPDERVDISGLPVVDHAKGRSPTSDIIDAFYITKLLQLELKLRRGLVRMQDLTEDEIWIFNRVTKTSDENILSREFIKKLT